MLPLLRSSAPLALTLATLALGSTGCAAKLGGAAHLSLPSPSVSVHGYSHTSSSAQAQAGAQGSGQWQGGGQVGGQAQSGGQWQSGSQAGGQAQGGGQWQSGGQAQGGGQWQSGGQAGGQAQGGGQWQSGGQAGGQAQGGGQWQSGGACGPVAALPPAPPPPPRQPWRPAPIFYGVPLEDAQDVIFVLDRSGSMTEADSGAPMGLVNPAVTLSTLTNAGKNAVASFQLPTSAAALGASSATVFAGLPGLAQGTFLARQTKLDIAKAELTGAIAGLPDGTRYNVVFFGDTVSELSPSLVSLNPVTRVGSMVFVQSIAPDGMTAAVPALRAAYASNPHRIVFLSDGLANVDGDGQQLLAEARVQMRRGVRFDTVGVGSDQDRPLMVALAQQSGGINTSR